MFEEERFENILKSMRVRKGKAWTQAKTAKLLGVSLRTYVGWENGESLPSRRDLNSIVATFELIDVDTDILFRAASQVAPEIQNLPFPQNPFFTGRKASLEKLDELFKKDNSVVITQPVSISGLGGIGKTQLALEYAHSCYLKKYRSIFWVNAADKTTLEASYLSLAQLLKLPERNEIEIDHIVQALKKWLEGHTSWLLILDNADDLQLVRSFLPTKSRGHILLTTRSQIVGNIAARIEIEAMELNEGLLFLLRRSGMLNHENGPETITSDIRIAATQLVELLGGHPLALDQAGAYIEETRDPSAEGTSSSFIEYIRMYHEQRYVLLNRRGSLGEEHPETVVVTLEISFNKARELYPNCTDVLYLCSFLHPDEIPEELFIQENVFKLNSLLFNEAISALRRYSLIKRNSVNKTLTVHRLVQAVIKDSMDRDNQQIWAERTVRAVEAILPRPPIEHDSWAIYERFLPHAQVCVSHIEELKMTFIEARRLLHQVDGYLFSRGSYASAESIAQQSLKIHEHILGSEHPAVAQALGNLAIRYADQGKFAEAELLYRRAILMLEQKIGSRSPEVAPHLTNLATLYQDQGKYAEAQVLYQEALAIWEKSLWPNLPHVAHCLNNLTSLYCRQSMYAEAEPLYKRSLYILEQTLGPNDPHIATCLMNLASIYHQQGKYADSESLYQRALDLTEQTLGLEHPNAVAIMTNLANFYAEQGKHVEAESIYQRCLDILEELRLEHPDAMLPLTNLANLYTIQGRYTEAKQLYRRALNFLEERLGQNHPFTQEIRTKYESLLQTMDEE